MHGRGGEEFPEQLEELQEYFEGNPEARVRAYPGDGLNIPIWLLGSSGFSARLAALKGLPFSFASHFAPQYTLPALQLYREHFQPSDELKEPYTMLGVNIIAAETDEKAQYLATSQQQQFISLRRGNPTPLKPPLKNIEEVYSVYELELIKGSLGSNATIVGNKETVKKKLESYIDETEADEVIINSQIFDQEDRLRSYEIVAEMME